MTSIYGVMLFTALSVWTAWSQNIASSLSGTVIDGANGFERQRAR